jgi:hypothetical protein
MRARMTRAESAADVGRCAAEFMPDAVDGSTGVIHRRAKHPESPELCPPT